MGLIILQIVYILLIFIFGYYFYKMLKKNCKPKTIKRIYGALSIIFAMIVIEDSIASVILEIDFLLLSKGITFGIFLVSWFITFFEQYLHKKFNS